MAPALLWAGAAAVKLILRQIIMRPDKSLLHPSNLMTGNALVQCLAATDLGLSKFFRRRGRSKAAAAQTENLP
jgi:hypothetical protein